MAAYPFIFGARQKMGGSGGGSISVAVSDANPDVGDTITITATPTGFTPTSYQFLLFNGTVTLLAQQVGNAYNWTVNAIAGSYEIYVLATDGTDNAFDTAPITVSAVYLLDLYSTANITDFATFKLRNLFTGKIAEIRRTVGATTTAVEIGFDGDYITLDSPVLAVTVGSSSATTLGQFVAASGYSDVDGLGSPQSAFGVRGYRQLNGALAWANTTAANQPRLVNAGVLDVENTKAAFVFSGNQWMTFGQVNGGTKPANYSLVGVGRILGGSADMYWCGSVSSAAETVTDYASICNRSTRPNRIETQYGTPPSSLANAYVGVTNVPVINNAQQLFEMYKTNAVFGVSMHVNGGASEAMTALFSTTGTINGGSEFNFAVGSNGELATYLLTGSMQCVLLYNDNVSTNRVGIKTSLNSLLGTSW